MGVVLCIWDVHGMLLCIFFLWDHIMKHLQSPSLENDSRKRKARREIFRSGWIARSPRHV